MAIREVIGMVGLAGLGGTWAVAWANRRLSRPDRVAMLDARTQFQARLDALRARTAMLTRNTELTADARVAVDEVVMEHVLIDSTLARAASADEVLGLVPTVERCLETLARAAASVGLELPPDQPFAGLCANDPQHGPATDTLTDGRPCCATCRQADADGHPRPVRLVARNGRPIPFDQIAAAPSAANP